MNHYMPNSRGVALFSIALLGLVAGCHTTSAPPPVPVVAPPSTNAQTQSSPKPEADGWQTFAPEGGDFSVSMPGVPQKETVQANSPFGPVTVNIYSLQTGALDYYVGYTEYPEGKITAANTEALLTQTTESMHKKPNVKFVSEKKMTLNDFPGRDMVLDSQAPSQLHQRFFLVKNRMYVFSAEYPPNHDYSKEVDRYLASFKLSSQADPK
ncbi:MAG: hypothetical protein JWN14_3685 [Chthonomonadales bacterium]|nr:hypothetical protein [Chthonomonadales bacterium]